MIGGLLLGKIDNIIFDLGGVIITIDYDTLYREFKMIGYNNLLEDFNPSFQSKLFKHFEEGVISENIFTDIISKKCYSNTSRNRIEHAWNSLITGVNINAIKMLPKIREKYKCFILSNINSLHESKVIEAIEQYMDWGDFKSNFKGIYFSYKIGLRKPDMKIFEEVINSQKLNTNKTLYLDDSEINIDMASSMGFKTVLVKNVLQTFKDLDSDFPNNHEEQLPPH